MIDQLDRRRTISSRWSGMSWRCEIDAPLIGPWWFLRHIGGRIFGPHGTHIELTPDESEALQERLQRACEQEIYAWAKESNLVGSVRDDTGVIVAPRFEKPNKAKRPADEAEFEANESRIARAVLDAAVASRKPPVKDPSVIEYESYSDFPSFCQIAHRKHQGRVEFAIIHMSNGGTIPTNMMESLASHPRQQFYPKVNPGEIDWFDVAMSCPPTPTLPSKSCRSPPSPWNTPTASTSTPPGAPPTTTSRKTDRLHSWHRRARPEVPHPRRSRPARRSEQLKWRCRIATALPGFLLS